MRHSMLDVALGLLAVTAILAQVPQTVSFQGKLVEGGLPVNGTRDIHFYLYNVESGGVSLWDENHTGVSVVNGLFNVELGGITSFASASVDFSRQYWIGIRVSGGAELSPRYKLTTAPYAMNLPSMGATDGQVLKWNNGLLKWQPGNDNTGTGTVPPGTSGQTLRHDGTNWVANSVLFNDGWGVCSNLPGGDPGYWIYKGDAGVTNLYWGILSTGIGSYNHLSISKNSSMSITGFSEKVTIFDNGYVGIGTANARSPLTVKQIVTPTIRDGGIRITTDAPSNPYRISIYVDSTNAYAGIQSEHEFAAWPPLSLNPSGGNVGIGTTSPNQQLEITKSFRMPSTTDATTGVIYKGSDRFIHNYGGLTNTFIGGNAGNFAMTGILNTGCGNQTLLSNTSGTNNTATGWSALYSNTTGSANTANGSGALSLNNTGSGNTAVGFAALLSNTSGKYNVAIGTSALYSNTTGIQNTAIGDSALFSNTTASGNTACGVATLLSNTTGSNNTATGYAALNSNTTGSHNSAYGALALSQNTTGYENTAIGSQALVYNTTGHGNVAVGMSLGFNTTGYYNIAIGSHALVYNTTGIRNIAIGAFALYSNTGSDNTAIGDSALYSNTTGYSNTACGRLSLHNNTTGRFNTAFGLALTSNTTAENNTAIGHAALVSCATGGYNTACGAFALRYNESSGNTAVGDCALMGMTTGQGNTACGALADIGGIAGNYNSAFGYRSGSLSTDISNATAIGNNALVDASNQVRIGNTSVSSYCVQVDWTITSDGRYKRDVHEDVPGLAFIGQLRPITYHWDIHKLNSAIYGQDTIMWDGKYDIEKIRWAGFIAQDVQKAAQECGYDFSGVDTHGQILGLRYAEFVVPLVKSVQELKAENDSLRARIEALERANRGK